MKLDYTPHNMTDIEVKVVTKLFEMLEEEGWSPHDVDDGGDELVPTTTWSEALEAIDSVEWSTLWVEKEGAHRVWVEFVTGNGADIVSDARALPKEFDALMDRYVGWLDTLEY